MFQAPKNFEEHQQMFNQMTPEQLCLYCEQHPFYSLPAGILNHRTKRAVAIMKDHALWLPQIVRESLASYLRDTFSQGQIVVTPHKMNNIYASLLNKHESISRPLRHAITEFVGFARAPMTREKQELLNQFVAHITPSQKQKKTSRNSAPTAGQIRHLSALFSRQK